MLLDQYLDTPYVLMPVKPNSKEWIHVHQGRPLYPTLDAEGKPVMPDLPTLVDAFQANPDYGISVSCPYIRGTDLLLFVIDVDILDPMLCAYILLIIANIIGEPCPFKVGRKGGTFFVTVRVFPDLAKLFEEHYGTSLDYKPWIKKGKIFDPSDPTNQQKAIDIVGSGSAKHTLLPPTRYLKTDLFYEWRAFPGTDVVMNLLDTPPEKLPCLRSCQLVLIGNCFRKEFKPIWDFLGGTSLGNFNDLMVSATLQLHNEFFSPEDNQWITLREARRSAESDEKFREREKQVIANIRGLGAKFPTRKPTTVRGRKSIPIGREAGDWLLSRLGVENCARFNGEPYIWSDQWRRQDRWARDQWLQDMYGHFPLLTPPEAKTAVEYVLQNMPNREPNVSPDLINFSNGVVDILTGELRLEERDDNFISRIPWPYDPTATCPTWDKYISDLLLPPASINASPQDHQKAIDFLEEFLGSCLVRPTGEQPFLMLIGPPGTGKSTLTKIVLRLIPGQVSQLGLESFNDPNAMLSMATSLVNFSPEAGRISLQKTVGQIVMKVTSYEPVLVKTLYRDAVIMLLAVRLIFTGNHMPEFHDSSGALERRQVILLTTEIRPILIENFDVIVARETPGILYKVVQKYRNKLIRGHFIKPDYSAVAAEEETKKANSVVRWYHENCEPVDDIRKATRNTDLYLHYKEWCEKFESPYTTMILSNWGKEMDILGHPKIRRRLSSTETRILKHGETQYPYVRKVGIPGSLY